MARNAFESSFRTSKMAAGAILSKINKVLFASEIARNAIKSEFRTSNMTDRSEMASNAIESEMADGSHFVNKNYKN